MTLKYEQLKEEQTQLYRLQSSNVQKLLDLNDQLKSRDSAQKQVEAELSRSKEDHGHLLETIEELHLVIEEKNFNIRLMQDELTALQLELLKLDERNLELSRDNKELLDRWLNKASLTADMLNCQLDEMQPQKSPNRVISCPRKEVFQIEVIGDVSLLVADPNNGLIAICTMNSPIVPIYDSKNVKKYELKGAPASGIHSGQFQADLFVGVGDSLITFWHVPTGKIRQTLSGHQDVITSVWFLTPDTLITGSKDKTIKVWDIPRGFCLKTIESPSPIIDLVSNSYGLFSTHSDGTLIRWDEKSSSALIHSAPIYGESPRLTLIGDDLLVTGKDSLQIVSCNDFHRKVSFTNDNLNLSRCNPSCTLDGKLVAVGTSDGTTLVWNRQWPDQVESVLPSSINPIVSTAWLSSTLLSAAHSCIAGYR